MAAKTMQKSSPSPILACLTICTASLLWLIPEPEKMGSFCPRIRVARQSMEEMPVWM